MKRFLFVLVAAGVLAPAALAKGPSEAVITGPGVKAVTIGGLGDGSGLTQDTGFFPAAFGQSPDPMLQGRPAGKLGPRYTIRYVVPAPEATAFHITQSLYPYAQGGALTYTKPGQAIFGMVTRGGWYRGGDALKQAVVKAGLPATAPRSGGGTDWTPFPTWVAALAGALLVLGASAFAVRRTRVAAPA